MYIDIRGNHPILFVGLRAYELRDQPKGITVPEAIKLLKSQGVDVER